MRSVPWGRWIVNRLISPWERENTKSEPVIDRPPGRAGLEDTARLTETETTEERESSPGKQVFGGSEVENATSMQKG